MCRMLSCTSRRTRRSPSASDARRLSKRCASVVSKLPISVQAATAAVLVSVAAGTSDAGVDVATGAGAIGGAVAGHKMENRNGRDNDIYRVTVTFENGSRRDFDYEDIDDLQVGDRVRVENGRIERI